ncbi:MAG TPA: HD-GYP domain-containing protein [Syntrophomonadaceae bacterium]|nr:HD-GYP domain-containing protein [Syntrophomonadaceae bacterium]
MKRLAIEQLKPGMTVARSIYSSDGRVLLQASVVLDAVYIKRLQQLSIRSIYVKNTITDFDVEIPDIISEITRVNTIKDIKQGFENIENNRKLNIRSVKTLVDNILDEILLNSNTLLHLSDIRTFDDYTFAHSVNVCVVTIMIGITLGYNDFKLRELGLGALLHDIGKTKIDKAILHKPDDLTAEEFSEITKHTEYGFEILRQYDDISLLSAHIAFQHHERWDGQGYPRKLHGDQIHEYARIVAVADVYDALLADRPYRPAYSINQTLTVLKRMAGIYLDNKCVDALISNVAIYPIGSIVELNTGDIAIVIDINKKFPTKPKLKIIYNKNTRSLCPPHMIDLSKMTTVVIKRGLSQTAFDNILHK